MSLIPILDIIGTVVFAMSGALSAIDKKMDIFGAAVIAFLTALGGGTIRDTLLGATPVGWMQTPDYLLYVLAGLVISILFNSVILRLRKTLFLFDTIGIAVFTILGIEKTLSFGLHPFVAVVMGMVSAVFGGVLRDIASNDIPLIFRKEIYALVCIVAGLLYVFILKQLPLPESLTILVTVSFVIAVRIFIVKYNISLPPLIK